MIADRYKIVLFSIISFLFFNSEVFSQDINFQNFSTKNGLPSTQVYNMYQDSYGIIWFATDHGICNYNGYKFEQFELEDGLTSTTVFKFYPQEDGNIWCTTANNQIFYFNPKERVFHPYQFNDVLSGNAGEMDCKDFFIDENNTLHLSYRGHLGFIAIDSNGTISNNVSLPSQAGSPGIVIETTSKNYSFTYLENAPIARPSHIERYKLELLNVQIEYYQGMVKDNLKIISALNDVFVINKQTVSKTITTGKRPITMGFLANNRFWIGYDFGGVIFYDFDGEPMLSLLEGESVTGVLIDHEGAYWISTLYSGVFYAKNIEDRNTILASNKNVHSLAVDQDGKLLVSLSNGDVYQKTTDGFSLWFKSTSFRPTICQYYPSINSMIYYGNNNLCHLNNQIHWRYVRKMPEDNGYPIYFPSNDFVLKESNMKNELSMPFKLKTLDVCVLDSFFLVSTKKGLYKYGFKSDQFKKIKPKKINCSTSDIDLFNENTFLIGTLGNGLGILKNDSLVMLTTEDGLTSNVIKEVYVQNDSTFWLCTNAGVNRIVRTRKEEYTISTYTTLDGLIDNDINDIEIIDGVVWLATNSGLSNFNASAINEKIIPGNYYLNIISKKVNNKVRSTLTELSYDQNKLEFTFQAISFRGNKDLNYRYRLVGLDETWNFTTNLNVVYEAVPPGEYVFELQVGINDKWVGVSKKVNIVISPPFYQTFWFIASCVLFGMLVIYLFFKYRILSYNREIIRDLLRHMLKRLNKGSLNFTVREKGVDVRINSIDVLYVKSLGNYIEIMTDSGKIVVRDKISNLVKIVPDPLAYLQVHRSYMVRVDKIAKKSVNSIFINNEEIKVGETYRHLLSQIQLV